MEHDKYETFRLEIRVTKLEEAVAFIGVRMQKVAEIMVEQTKTLKRLEMLTTTLHHEIKSIAGISGDETQ